MKQKFDDLKPERLWHYFLEICKIPRPSGKEDQIIRYLKDFGKSHGLETITDETNNVLIRKPATKGNEKKKAVVLQSHMDMVCEKNAATVHDFLKDPIHPYLEEGWVKAKGTTLGADDGIGIAAQLAILESKDVSHGPVECLFTVDEETGLTGAFGLKKNLLQSRILLNLDSEDEGQLFIGCAGGIDTVATFSLLSEPPGGGTVAYKISITGLRGGHSGDDINKGLGNAVKLLNRVLWNAASRFQLRISSLDAGNLRNAIAREGFAIVTIPDELRKEFEAFVQEYHTIFREEYRVTEEHLKIAEEPCDMPGSVVARDLSRMLMNALYACPHGVLEYSRDIPGLVETSTNLASVKFSGEKIIVTTSQRSSVETARRDAADMVECVFRMADAGIEHSAGYPGWKPNPASEIVKLTVHSYKDLFGQQPQVLAIHAGLECGLIGALYPGMDMVSFGPTIKGAHSPDERLEVASVEKFWGLLVDVLGRIPQE
jgi:dipeptidase D